ncbi:MAG: SDR family oxidoreductase [Bacteriovorax sp.]|nr:SDR family oxidoreductase [Bacteriovorax sp.]
MIIFITGATSGFGFAMATRFLNHGHQVIATGRRGENLAELKIKFPKNLHTIKLDIRNREEVKKTIAHLPEDFKKIDVLINNAGLALGINAAQKASLDDWEVMVDTNINGILNCTHYILPGMVERNFGHIVNLGSIAGEFPYPGGNVYGATKAFAHQFTLNLKADLLGTKVRVTSIEPGMCQTEFSEVRFRGDKEKADSVYKGMTALTADDIAETIDWVISRPAHININVISLMPTQQAFGAFTTSRNN